jgi:NTE family protein
MVALTGGPPDYRLMTDRNPPRVAVALQGGGAHGAFTWGVLDKLVQDGMTPDAICGVSSGAIVGTMLTQGMVRGGRRGAREEMRKFWTRLAQAHALSPLQNAPLEKWLWGWDMSNSVLWQGMEMAMRLFSPAQLNPFGHNPLWYLLHDLVDPRLLCDPAAPRMFVCATNVETGRAEVFENAEISADVLCASACLPFVFPAVRIGERAYWDGGYSGNPPLSPLLKPDAPRELILIRAQMHARSGIPSTPTEITNRLNEIACQNVLEAELAALPAGVTLISYDADEALADLPISSKLNGEEAFLHNLFEAGRSAVRR